MASAGIFLLWFTWLMTSHEQKTQFVRGAGISAVVITVIGLIEHKSANRILMLYIDGMLAITIGSLPVAKGIRKISREYEGGPLPRNWPGMTPVLWVCGMLAVVAVLLTAEYYVFRGARS
jgi:hypothetical protein